MPSLVGSEMCIRDRHKSMIRVSTPRGIVDVTDDHSLLRPDGREVSPNDVKLGDDLLHHPLPEYMDIISEKIRKASDRINRLDEFQHPAQINNYNVFKFKSQKLAMRWYWALTHLGHLIQLDYETCRNNNTLYCLPVSYTHLTLPTKRIV